MLDNRKWDFFTSKHDIFLPGSSKEIHKINLSSLGHLLGGKMYMKLFDKSYPSQGFSFGVEVYRALCMSTPGRYSSVGLNIAPAPTLAVPSTTSSATIVTEQEGTSRWMLMAVDKPTAPAPITTTFAVMTENTIQYCTSGNGLGGKVRYIYANTLMFANSTLIDRVLKFKYRNHINWYLVMKSFI